MKTSQTKILQIEKYIAGKLSPEDTLIFEAHLLTSRSFRLLFNLQKKVQLLVKFYHRKKLKEELESIHEEVFSDPNNFVFRQRVYSIFE